MGKHAYLIMAHGNLETLKCLLEELDDERNNIFVHLDIKLGNIDTAFLLENIKKSPVMFIERMAVTWGAYSQVACEMRLLEAGVTQLCDYYHLISGEDFPIKNQEDIHQFFQANQGTEFIHFQREKISDKNLARVKYRYPWQEKIGKKKNGWYVLARLYKILQKLIHRNYINDTSLEFQMGANWFSITHEFATYLLEQEATIEKYFKFSLNGDELFVQTIFVNSPFVSRISQPNFEDLCSSNRRFVKWDYDVPKYLTEEDLLELLECNEFFARKINLEMSKELIEQLRAKLK